MYRLNFVPAMLFSFAAAVASLASAFTLADFPDYSLRNASNQVILPGRLYTPPAAQLPGAAPLPLIINLAGSGGYGTDNLIQLDFLTIEMLTQAQQRSAYIYAPLRSTTFCKRATTNSTET